jgi:nicotinate-nucleotide adenylyltransferase
LARHPRIDVTGFEADIGTRYTADTIAWLNRRCPGARFVWIMGADNLAGFHRWRNWRDICRMAAIAVIDRPGSTLRATRSPAGVYLSNFRAREHDAARLAEARRPAFVFLHGPRSDLSSTSLREARKVAATM